MQIDEEHGFADLVSDAFYYPGDFTLGSTEEQFDKQRVLLYLMVKKVVGLVVIFGLMGLGMEQKTY